MTETDIPNELAFDLYARWEDERATGNNVSLEEICAAHVEMLPEVQKIASCIGTVGSLLSAAPCDTRPPGGVDEIKESWPSGWSEIGSGASSIVFKGEDPTFGTEVAFKVLHTQNRVLSSTALVQLMKRFELEARILARLKHDGIVRIFKTFNFDGRPVLEMEYLPGGNLDKNAGAVRAKGVVGIARFMERVARAVGFAHAHKIVHRDLKPSNILLDADGLPCVSDFGVAKLLQFGDRRSQGSDSSGETDQGHGTGLTTNGRQPGTKAYMAPEQFEPSLGAITPATDVWALGVIIYELLHGTRPFSGAKVHEWKSAVCNGTLPRPRWVWCRRKRLLNKIALRCMSRHPAKRYANAAAVADALTVATRSVWQILPRYIGVMAVVAAITAFVLTGPIAKPVPPPPEVSQAALTRDAQDAIHLCQSGKVSKGLFAFADLLSRIPADLQELRAAIHANIFSWAGSLAAVEGLYTHPELISAIAASSDGRWVAVGDQSGGVLIWDPRNARIHKRLIGHSSLVMSAAFSHDGRHLITGGKDCTACVWSIDEPNDIAATSVLNIGAWVYAVAFTPDGEHAVTGTVYDAPSAGRLVGVNFWNLRTQKRVQRPENQRVVRAFVTDASGKKLLVLSADNEAEVWDLSKRLPRGTLIADGKPVIVRSAAYSRDGKTIATGGDRLLFWDAETLTLRTEESREETEVFGFAPDGAVVVRSGGELRLWQPSANCSDLLRTPRPIAMEIKAVAGEHLIGLEDQRTVARLNWPRAAVRSMPIPRDCVAVLAVGSGNGSYAAVTTAPDATSIGKIGRLRSGIHLWDLQNGQPAGLRIETSDTLPTVTEFDAQGHRFLFQPGRSLQRPFGERPVRLFDVTSGQALQDLEGHHGEVYAARYLKHLPGWITGGEDEFVRISPSDGKPPIGVKLPGAVGCMSISSDERGLAVGCADGKVAYLSLSPPDQVELMWERSFGGMIDQVTISPDGATVVVLGRDRRLWAWAVKDGAPLAELIDARELTAVFPQPGGTGWVTIHLDGAVRWWPALTANKPSQEWVGNVGCRFVSLDPTGDVLVEAKEDQAQAWSIRASLPIGPPVRHCRQVQKAIWGNGNLLTLSQKSVRIWQPVANTLLPDEEHLVAWLTALTGTTPESPLTDVKWRDVRWAAQKNRPIK